MNRAAMLREVRMEAFERVKSRLQEAGLVKKGRRKGPHRERRERKPASAFAPLLPSLKAKLPDVLCLKAERTVGNDNCVVYEGRKLQIPPHRHRCHYVRAKVAVHEYGDGSMAVFHGATRLGRYDAAGRRLGKAGASA